MIASNIIHTGGNILMSQHDGPCFNFNRSAVVEASRRT
jgi:hypothetical protein